MSDILSVTVPIYLLIGLGYVAVRSEWFTKAETRVLGRYVIQLALPMLVFQSLSQRRFSEIVDPRYLGAYLVGSLGVMAAAWWVARKGMRRPTAFSAFFATGMSYSNSSFVGYPIALQLLGPTAAIGLAMCMLVENIVMLPLTLTVAHGNEAGHPWHRSLATALGRLAKNPLVLSIVAGMTASLLGLSLPGPVSKVVSLLAGASAATSLFVIGGGLVGLHLRGQWRLIGVVAAGKLLLFPLVMLGLALLLHVPEPLRPLLVIYASVPMLSIYPILAQPFGEEAFCAAALLLTTLLSFLTISGWLWVLTQGLGWI